MGIPALDINIVNDACNLENGICVGWTEYEITCPLYVEIVGDCRTGALTLMLKARPCAASH